jgi:hypothetical protein
MLSRGLEDLLLMRFFLSLALCFDIGPLNLSQLFLNSLGIRSVVCNQCDNLSLAQNAAPSPA